MELNFDHINWGNLSADFESHTLLFLKPSGTSRGILTEKKLWLITIKDSSSGRFGVGECSIIPGLSPDYWDDDSYEKELKKWCKTINQNKVFPKLMFKPSIQFGFETALLQLQNHQGNYFDSPLDFGYEIPINGLVWMGDQAFMQSQIDEKLNAGFSCIKMKVGAIDFDIELEILKKLRHRYSEEMLCIRVDANGAFNPENALSKLEQLSKIKIHSIEQPIMAQQWSEMRKLCQSTPLPIALDEELIERKEKINKDELLNFIQPQYIVLKPSLHGGFLGTNEWINAAEKRNIPWWITSALESNIGLRAIAEFTATFQPKLWQGLGTGSLYQTNFESTFDIRNGKLRKIFKP